MHIMSSLKSRKPKKQSFVQITDLIIKIISLILSIYPQIQSFPKIDWFVRFQNFKWFDRACQNIFIFDFLYLYISVCLVITIVIINLVLKRWIKKLRKTSEHNQKVENINKVRFHLKIWNIIIFAFLVFLFVKNTEKLVAEASDSLSDNKYFKEFKSEVREDLNIRILEEKELLRGIKLEFDAQEIDEKIYITLKSNFTDKNKSIEIFRQDDGLVSNQTFDINHKFGANSDFNECFTKVPLLMLSYAKINKISSKSQMKAELELLIKKVEDLQFTRCFNNNSIDYFLAELYNHFARLNDKNENTSDAIIYSNYAKNIFNLLSEIMRYDNIESNLYDDLINEIDLIFNNEFIEKSYELFYLNSIKDADLEKYSRDRKIRKLKLIEEFLKLMQVESICNFLELDLELTDYSRLIEILSKIRDIEVFEYTLENVTQDDTTLISVFNETNRNMKQTLAIIKLKNANLNLQPELINTLIVQIENINTKLLDNNNKGANPFSVQAKTTFDILESKKYEAMVLNLKLYMNLYQNLLGESNVNEIRRLGASIINEIKKTYNEVILLEEYINDSPQSENKMIVKTAGTFLSNNG